MHIVVVVILFASAFSHAVTLEELINEALKNSPILKQKNMDVKVREAKGRSVKAQRFGEVKALLKGTRYEGQRILYPLTPPLDPKNLVGAENQIVAALSYTLPLFTGFELQRSIDIANLMKEIREIDYRLTKNQLVFNIKSVYLKVLELQRNLRTLEAYRSSLEKLHSDVKLAVELSKKAEADLFKVRYQLEQVQGEIEKVRNSLMTLKQVIIYLVGREDLDLSKFEDIGKTHSLNLNNLDRKVGELEVLRRTNLYEKVAHKKLEIAKGKYLPKVYFNASAQRNIGNGEYKDLWQVGFVIEFTLLDFGKRKSHYIQSKLELEKARLVKKNLKLKIKKDITDALGRIRSAQANIEVARRQIEYAKKIEEVEEAKYNEGVSDMFNLLYAKAQRIKAETEYYRAFYERERAVAYLYYLLEEFKDE